MINRFVSNKSKAPLAGRYAKKIIKKIRATVTVGGCANFTAHEKLTAALAARFFFSFSFFLKVWVKTGICRATKSVNSIHRKCLGSRWIAVHMKGSGESSHCRLLFGDGGCGGSFLASRERGPGTTGFMFHFYPLLPTHVAPPKHKARWIIYNAFRRKKHQTSAEGKCCCVTDLRVNNSTKSPHSGGLQCSLQRSGVLVAMETFSAHTSHTMAYQKLRLDWILSVLLVQVGLKKKKTQVNPTIWA